ncbi:MBL fold metallo-hydrolase [Chitinophaga qingshengii]|uniref:MBL fold metallo-hydrolase n=1 Tax=Chitinophaga qingshengii TaxID=1569794 RepID=A0ABR7TW35_9BACT|nr:MBL fold metallo-hydrolase [Chitinophaga qingshengii]MBC9934701.1 MBL fold metallo-hydrolase [Chitinophaga qingshengii]
MKITHLKSATVAIESNGVKILSDPWLTDGEYYGSWFHYPKFEFRESFFSDIDYIYVSHIHPDHFSKETFQLLDKNIPVLIHSYDSKFLKLNLERLGFTVIELPHNQRTLLKKDVYINILAADNCNPELCGKFFGCSIVESKYGSTQIDTLCVIDDGKYAVLNTNDCPYDLAVETLQIVKEQYNKIDFMLVGYGGAGPFPQCFSLSENDKLAAAERKKDQFLKQGEAYISYFQPSYYMPFAGTYTLGGKLAHLNKYKGVPELEEARIYFEQSQLIDQEKSNAVLLNTYSSFDLASASASSPYQETNLEDKQAYINNILSRRLFAYEGDVVPTKEQILSLIKGAYERMESKRKEIGFVSPTEVIIKALEDELIVISMNGGGYRFIADDRKSEIESYVVYALDSRLFHRILQGPKLAHWNNAEIGSHINFERQPNIFERGIYHVMCFFHA